MAQDNNTAPLEFSCKCGQIRANIAAETARSGSHVGCYCSDCRATELYMKQPDPAPGPVDLFVTTQDTLTITQGAQHLGLFRLSPRGTMRWYATCCNTPLFNTATTPKFSFLGVRVATMLTPERVGPVIAKLNMPKPGGKTGQEGMMLSLWRLLPRILASRLSGRWRQTPLFNVETGDPIAETKMPSIEERAALYPG